MPDLTRDPVCAMEIGIREVMATAVTQGHRSSFCCFRCHAAFLDAPHRYAGFAGDPSRLVRVQDGWSTRPGATIETTTSPGPEPCHFAS